jgi:hypothetical protein
MRFEGISNPREQVDTGEVDSGENEKKASNIHTRLFLLLGDKPMLTQPMTINAAICSLFLQSKLLPCLNSQTA